MGRNVLVVDDSDTIRTVVKITLEKNNFTVICAENGREALDILKSTTNIDVVLLDINMPILTGLGVLQELSKSPLTYKPNILMLTTETNSKSIKDCNALGARGYLIKPVDNDQLLITVDAYCT